MRVRIVQQMQGSIDGIDLTKLRVGQIYDFQASLANYLMASGYAEPAGSPSDRNDDPSTTD